jgi:DNA-binding GntR family transcriptional regulator
MPPLLEPIEPLSLKDQAYSRIKKLILSGHFSPGEALPLDELSSQLGISRTPLRDAIHELENDHLVTTVPYRGTYVAEISSESVLQIYQVREALEVLATRSAMSQIPDEELQEVQVLFDAITANTEDVRPGQYRESDVQLHQLVQDHCDNAVLQELLTHIGDRIHQVRRFSSRQGVSHLEQSFREHRRILDALLERDEAEATRLMAEHIRNARRRIVNLL